MVHVAALPNGEDVSVFTKPDNGIKTIADLMGKKPGVGKATSAQNLPGAALEADGLKLSDFEVTPLGPADAAAISSNARDFEATGILPESRANFSAGIAPF